MREGDREGAREGRREGAREGGREGQKFSNSIFTCYGISSSIVWL